VKAIEDESVTLFEPEYVDRAQLNFFGHGTHVQETTVTVLKTAVFASVIRTQNGDIPLDDKLLNAERKLCYDAIEHLNNDVYRTIVTSVETTLVKTMTVEKLFTDHGNAPFCENVSCSQRLFQGSTRGFFASKSLHMFNDDERDIFLDSILPFFNLEDADGSPNSAMQTDGMPKAWARARERQAKAIADMEARYWTPKPTRTAAGDGSRRSARRRRGSLSARPAVHATGGPSGLVAPCRGRGWPSPSLPAPCPYFFFRERLRVNQPGAGSRRFPNSSCRPTRSTESAS